MARKKKRKFFLFLAPALAVLGALVFLVTSKKTAVPFACNPVSYSGEFRQDEKLAVFEGEEISVPALSSVSVKDMVLGVAAPGERWIEVDLSEQRLRAWDGNALFLETAISTGLPWWPTPKGEFRIWVKLRYSRMEGGQGRYYYNLPNVPYVMYFENSNIPSWRGYGLHGTYWHDAFGTQRSHGCVNLPTPIAERLFYWATPELGNREWSVFASNDNPGTRIIIHE